MFVTCTVLMAAPAQMELIMTDRTVLWRKNVYAIIIKSYFLLDLSYKMIVTNGKQSIHDALLSASSEKPVEFLAFFFFLFGF